MIWCKAGDKLCVLKHLTLIKTHEQNEKLSYGKAFKDPLKSFGWFKFKIDLL